MMLFCSPKLVLVVFFKQYGNETALPNGQTVRKCKRFMAKGSPLKEVAGRSLLKYHLL